MQMLEKKVQQLFQKQSVRVAAIHHGSGMNIDAWVRGIMTKNLTLDSLISLNKSDFDKGHIDEIEIADIVVLEASNIELSTSNPETFIAPPPGFDYLILRCIANKNPNCIVIWVSEKAMPPVEHVDLQFSYDSKEDIIGLLQRIFVKS
jgi:hypothetical protein